MEGTRASYTISHGHGENSEAIESKLDHSISSVLFGGGAGGKFAEEAEQGGCGFLIGEIFKSHGGGEMRRGGVETNADEILVAPGGQRIHHRAEFYGPVFLGSENDWAGTSDGPGASAGGTLRARVTRPAMTDDVEMEAWGESHVGFESKRFLLLAPATKGPLYRERARQEANG
jgi:hypothetical protein